MIIFNAFRGVGAKENTELKHVEKLIEAETPRD